MKNILLGTLAIFAAVCCIIPSCETFHLPAQLPFDFGVRYELEPELFIVVTPDPKGGLDVEFDGSGSLFAPVQIENGNWSLTSRRTGITYKVTQQPNGRPLVTATGGTGKVRLVPTNPPPVATPVPDQ